MADSASENTAATQPIDIHADADTRAEEEIPSKSEPEFVLTPEVMRRENRRNDIILAFGVILFAFFLASFLETMPDIWLRFRTGQLIDQTLPNLPRTDTLTYTAEGRPWINPSWLFDWTIYLIYAWLGDAALIVVKALICALAASILISLRHPGPTLWWSALCSVPIWTAMSMRLNLSPEIAELLLTSLFLGIWFQARYCNRWWMLYLMVPLTALWANLSISFILAPSFLAVLGIGESVQLLLREDRDFGDSAVNRRPLHVFAVAIFAGLATLLNPYGWDGATLPLRWWDSVLPRVSGIDTEMAGWASINLNAFLSDLMAGTLPWSWNAWVFLVISSLASFLLNLRFFSFSRFLLTLAAVLLPLIYARFIVPSAIVLGVSLSLNGQELFLGFAGERTRISTAWWLWSIAGRAASILVVAALILAACTGRVQSMIGRFGYGILMNRFMVDGAEWLDKVDPQGNGFSFSAAISSYEAWASPSRKSFVDSRWQVVAGELSAFGQLRDSLHQGAVDQWKPVFDKYNISYVLYDPQDNWSMDSLTRLLNSPELAPVYVSDQAVIFCRTDANIDSERFAKHRIEPNQIVFREGREPPTPTDHFPEPPGIIDRLWRFRYVVPPGYDAANIYLAPTRPMVRPGALFMGLSKLRDAVSADPDNSRANLQLSRALLEIYRGEARVCIATLKDPGTDGDTPPANVTGARPVDTSEEVDASALSKIVEESTPESGITVQKEPRKGSSSRIPPPRFLMVMRHYQIISALQNAITAGPLSANADLEMYAYCSGSQFYDMALEHLEAARPHLTPEQWSALVMDHEALSKVVAERRGLYDRDVAAMTKQLQEQGVEPDRPLERAMIAMKYELPGLAVEQLEMQSPFSPEMIKAAPFAIGLYLSVGRPDRALERLKSIQAQSPLGPGEWDWLSAQVRICTGQYDEARTLLEHAIAEVRAARAARLLAGVEDRLRHGRVLSMPIQANQALNELEQEARYWFQLGLIRIEMGEPHLVKQAFKKTLELSPHFTLRPIIEVYWKLVADDEFPPEPEIPDESTTIVRHIESPTSEAPTKPTEAELVKPKEEESNDLTADTPSEKSAKESTEASRQETDEKPAEETKDQPKSTS